MRVRLGGWIFPSSIPPAVNFGMYFMKFFISAQWDLSWVTHPGANLAISTCISFHSVLLFPGIILPNKIVSHKPFSQAPEEDSGFNSYSLSMVIGTIRSAKPAESQSASQKGPIFPSKLEKHGLKIHVRWQFQMLWRPDKLFKLLNYLNELSDLIISSQRSL